MQSYLTWKSSNNVFYTNGNKRNLNNNQLKLRSGKFRETGVQNKSPSAAVWRKGSSSMKLKKYHQVWILIDKKFLLGIQWQ